MLGADGGVAFLRGAAAEGGAAADAVDCDAAGIGARTAVVSVLAGAHAASASPRNGRKGASFTERVLVKGVEV